MRKTRYSMLISLVAVLVAIGLNAWYTVHVQTETEHKFCGVVSIFDNPSMPPSNPRSQQVANRMHTLRKQLGC